MRRWAEQSEDISGPAEQALRAWMRLNGMDLAWRPGVIAIGESNNDEIAEQIALRRQHAIGLGALLRKVTSREGPSAPWDVDLDKNLADLESMS